MHNQNVTATTFTPCEIAEFFAQQGEDFATALQRIMGAVEKRGVVFSPFGDAYQARYDGWLVPANEVDSADLSERMLSEEFYQWVGSLGYDTRPYYQAASGRVRLPVGFAIGFADGRRGGEYGACPAVLLTVIETLHSLGVGIVVPDYAGCNHNGDTVWTPTERGWVSFYDDLRD
jgi:hypothetical protein